MSNGEVAAAVYEHFRRSLMMFREAILAFPESEWRKGETDYLRPAGVAYHVVEAIDFYTGEKSPDMFPWGGRFDMDWENPDSDRLPSQEKVITYLDEIEERLRDWFRETDMLAPETLFPWTGSLVLSRTVYVLRNIQHHLSEMSLELTRRGYKSPVWL